jgi:hypothetical protein
MILFAMLFALGVVAGQILKADCLARIMAGWHARGWGQVVTATVFLMLTTAFSIAAAVGLAVMLGADPARSAALLLMAAMLELGSLIGFMIASGSVPDLGDEQDLVVEPFSEDQARRGVLDHIAAHGELRASVRCLAQQWGVGKSTAARWRKRLIEQGIVCFVERRPEVSRSVPRLCSEA